MHPAELTFGVSYRDAAVQFQLHLGLCVRERVAVYLRAHVSLYDGDKFRSLAHLHRNTV